MTCSRCGKPGITKEFAEHLSRERDIPISYFEVCDECHRKELSVTMGKIANWEREARSMKYQFYVNPDACTGCRSCELACSFTHAVEGVRGLTRINPLLDPVQRSLGPGRLPPV